MRARGSRPDPSNGSARPFSIFECGLALGFWIDAERIPNGPLLGFLEQIAALPSSALH
jgi:hypothetical protein